MSNTIKVIDLFNKIANGEEVPKKIRWRDKIWDYWDRDQDYKSKQGRWFTSNLNDIRTREFVTDIVEIIEKQEEIDIQSIEELDENFTYIENHISGLGIEKVLNKAEIELVNKINKLVQAVKQLDKKIKEK